MARNVLNSHLFSARNFILEENTRFRSSPLLVAAKRCASAWRTETEITKNTKIEIMEELKDEIRRLREEIQSLRGEIDEIKGDNAENNSILKRILNAIGSRN